MIQRGSYSCLNASIELMRVARQAGAPAAASDASTITRVDRRTLGMVDVWDDASAPAHARHEWRP
jgi:hypothetical protein